MKKPTIENGFEVEWTTDLGEQLPDDFNPDKVKYQRRDFVKHSEAVRFAKQVLPQDKIGEVRITSFHLEPYEQGIPVFHKEYDAESELVS